LKSIIAWLKEASFAALFGTKYMYWKDTRKKKMKASKDLHRTLTGDRTYKTTPPLSQRLTYTSYA